METKPVLPVLSNDNFQRWKYDVKAWLEALEIFEVVNGTASKPESPPEAVAKWNKNDARARGVIASTLTELHHSMIRSCATSSQMWTKLVGLFEMSSTNNKVLLHQQYHKYKFESGMNIATYMSGLNVLLQRLDALNETVEETSIIAKIINDLPPEYENFRHSWNLASATSTVLNKSILEQQLLSVEASFGSSTSVQGEAFMSGRNKSTKKRVKKPKKLICYECEEEGHFRRQCPKFKNRKKNAFDNVDGLYAGVASLKSSEMWYADSGASYHMTRNRDWFDKYDTLTEHVEITIANDKVIRGIGKGTINVEAFNGKQWIKKRLDDVIHVPDLGPTNLFSMSKACDKDLEIFGDSKTIGLKKKSNGQVVVIGERTNNIWVLMLRRYQETELFEPSKQLNQAAAAIDYSLRTWHERFGHVNSQKIKMMAKNQIVEGLQISESDEYFCKGCILGRMTKRSFKSNPPRECQSGEFVHTDLCGPMRTQSVGGSSYMMVLKDEYSGYRQVYFLKTKDQALDKFKDYVTRVKNVTGNRVKRLRSDNGTEFTNQRFQHFMKDEGIQHDKTVPYNPQMNGMAERENRTLVELAKSMLLAKDLPTTLWAEAVSTAAYVMNRVVNRKELSKTPYEMWFRKKPDVSHLRVFGSAAYHHVPGELRSKWEPNAKEMILVGYTDSSKIYRLYDRKTGKLYTSTNVVFDEVPTTRKISLYDFDPQGNEQESSDEEEDDEIKDDSTSNKQEGCEDEEEDKFDSTSNPVESTSSNPVESTSSNSVESTSTQRCPGRPKGSKTKPKLSETEFTMTLRQRPPKSLFALMAGSTLDEPASYQEAISNECRKEWEKAMDDEFKSLMEHKTWKLVELPPNRRAIKCRWVYKVKQDTR